MSVHAVSPVLSSPAGSIALTSEGLSDEESADHETIVVEQ